jgi:hypothetical protein
MPSRSDKKSGPQSRAELERQFTRSLKWVFVSGALFGVSIGFAVFTSNGMPGHDMWSVARVPTTIVASAAAIALASSGSKVLWTKKELNDRSR